MNFKNLITSLLVEADKKQILITKLGLNDENAETLSSLCGPLAVWMGNKYIDFIYSDSLYKSRNYNIGPPTKQQMVDTINSRNSIVSKRGDITSIMDWIRVGLDGNINTIKSEPYNILLIKSREWHESLGVGEGDIDYVEENTVVLDFRENGIGFYWADLDTNDSSEECDRMGHCGRTQYGNSIFSLRETKRIHAKHTKNVSHLTAAVTRDGIIVQLKGQKNSKPKKEYHPYIIPFLLSDKVTGFGFEYDSGNDFKISDLQPEEVRSLYQQKPSLFAGYSSRKILEKLGIIEKKDMVFELRIEPSDVDRYVDGDRVLRQYKTKDGRTKNVTYFETIFSGEDLYESYGYEGDWELCINYYTDNNSESKIWERIKRIAQEQSIDIDGMDLTSAIKEVDDDELQVALVNAKDACEADSYHDHLMDGMRDALSKYGNIVKLNYEGVVINVNIDSLINYLSIEESEIDEISIDCKDNPSCMLEGLMNLSDFEKPDFDLDDRWRPDVDKTYFNQAFMDYFSDLT